jgi:GNAT superfamily N-acetyltransferase
VGAAGGHDPSGLSLRLVRITDDLPEGFEALRREAEADGHRQLTRLAAEWAAAPGMFHGLLTAYADGELAGIGGITDEPEGAGEPAWRMRRLYVARGSRRQGVGQALAGALLQEALGAVRLVTVHAGDAEAARFWEAMGFEAVAGRGWSHAFRGGGPARPRAGGDPSLSPWRTTARKDPRLRGDERTPERLRPGGPRRSRRGLPAPGASRWPGSR